MTVLKSVMNAQKSLFSGYFCIVIVLMQADLFIIELFNGQKIKQEQ